MASESHHNHQPQVIEIKEEQQQRQQTQQEQQEQQLKYLGFVHVASAQALMRWSAAYGYAKERSGAMRPGVQTVEECVKSVVGPVYDKFHLVPDEILRYADQKLDNSVAAAQVAPAAARDTVAEAVRSVYAKCEPSAKELYERYEPMAEQCAASAWRRLNRLPLFPRVADAVLPKAAYCTEKYNQAVVAAAEKGYRVSPYLPTVPTEKIARVFSEKEA